MASLLVRVRTKLTLHVRHKARSPLLGDYPSLHKGRSMDFDDLREYQRGDDVRDIDWKSTARTGSVLLKRYVAVRKQNVLIVVDTGRSMTALAQDGAAKSELAVPDRRGLRIRGGRPRRPRGLARRGPGRPGSGSMAGDRPPPRADPAFRPGATGGGDGHVRCGGTAAPGA